MPVPEAKPKKLLKITPEFLAEVGRLAGRGFTHKLLAMHFGVCITTWHDYKKEHPEIWEAWAKGRCKKIDQAAGILWEKVEEGDLPATMFYLKTQGGWRETGEPQVYNEDPQTEQEKPATNISINVSDPIEAARIYQEIMKRGE